MLKILDVFCVLVVLSLQIGHIFLLTLPGILRRLSVSLQLLLFAEGTFVVSIGVCHVLVLEIYVLSGLHQFSHFVPVKDFFLLLRVPMLSMVLTRFFL